MRRIFKWAGIAILLALVAGITFVLIFFPPVMTGMDAKVMCSCVYVTGRSAESVKEKELQVFPGLTLANITMNENDSSVTAQLLWSSKTAIYRKGLGCTLLAEKTLEELRAQRMNAPLLRDPSVLDTVVWPAGNRIDTTRIPGVNYHALNEAIEIAFAEADPKKPVHTHGLAIVYDGKLIGERYAEGMNYNSRLMGWSMTKSVANALVGILVKQGRLTVEDPAPVQAWRDDERNKITLNNLLQASSGLQWSESYFNPVSDFHRMFIHRDDKGAFAASLPAEFAPGSKFEYSSGTTNILSRIIRQEVGDENYYRFPYQELFYKLGMYTAIMEPDASGTFVASSYCYASARDWARFGMLYLNDGIFNNERILPEGWVKYSTNPALANDKRDYGAQIWLNAGRKENPSDCREPGLPNDAYFFEGFEENTVVIIPSRKLVIVRLGVTHHGNFQLGKFVSAVMNAIPGGGLVADSRSHKL